MNASVATGGATEPVQPGPLLAQVLDPADVRRLAPRQLRQLADELRHYVLHSVARTGGHLSSNLGTVELTLALHYVFQTPDDRLIWDVGHQTYPHKIITGRREAMASLRQLDGLSGFPRREESAYDAFGTAHSSTSISAALGMAMASRLQGSARHHVAVIGDGAMSAGMAFEALNNAGTAPDDIRLLVVLNDNEMSISPPVGALNKYLARLLSNEWTMGARQVGKGLLEMAPPLAEFAQRLEEHVKGMVTPATLFEEFGFRYFGPIDGHDLDALVPTLRNLRGITGPVFLHVITRKGSGYAPAEADPVRYHGPGRFDPAQGLPTQAAAQHVVPRPTYTEVFSQWVCDMAASDERLVAITPAMREGSGLVAFEQQFPKRYVDVGIAEQHAVTFAAGLACEGMKPVVAIYSTFLQRAYDQLIHDVALQNLDVTFAIDRAGLVGADGATHAGNYDLAYLRCVPNMVIATPSDELECRQLLSTAYHHPGPAAVRYPRGQGPGVAEGALAADALTVLPIGRGVVRRSSQAAARSVVMFAFGSMVASALAVAERLDATVVDMRFVKPLDEALVLGLAAEHAGVVTLEEACLMGGAGSAVLECLQHAGRSTIPVLRVGLPDQFIDHGDVKLLLARLGLDPDGILRQIRAYFSSLWPAS